MSNQPTKAQKVLHGAAGPPGERPPWIDALRAEFRDVVRSELRRERRREAVPEMLDREEAADALGVSTRTLSTLTAAGEVQAVRIKGRVLYSAGALRAYIRRQAGEGAK